MFSANNFPEIILDKRLEQVVIDEDQFKLVPYLFGYNILTSEGYYNEEGEFNPYTTPLPKELNKVSIAGLSATQMNGVTYLLYPGGGHLFTFEKGAIKRLDLSFPHLNYYDAHFFSHQNTLYLLGGYGLWTTKNDLLRYDFILKEWEKVKTIGELPDHGLSRMSVVKTNDELYIVHADYVETQTQQRQQSNIIYVLNLNRFEWSKRYVLEDKIVKRLASNRNYGVQLEDSWIVFPSIIYKSYLQINPVEGTIKESPELDFVLSNQKPLLLGKQLVAVRRENLGSPQSSVLTYDYQPTSYTLTEKLVPFGRKIQNIILLLTGGLSLLLIFLFRFFFTSRTFRLDKDKIGKGMRWVELFPNEYFFLQKIAQYGSIKNSELLQLFEEEGKSNDLFIKRKNAMLMALEAKLKQKFGTSFFQKEIDPHDKRNSIYTITPKIIIRYSN